MMAKALEHFTITPNDDDYILHVEDEDGDTLELTATAEQLDLISEAIDGQLEADVDEIDAIDEE